MQGQCLPINHDTLTLFGELARREEGRESLVGQEPPLRRDIDPVNPHGLIAANINHRVDNVVLTADREGMSLLETQRGRLEWLGRLLFEDRERRCRYGRHVRTTRLYHGGSLLEPHLDIRDASSNRG